MIKLVANRLGLIVRESKRVAHIKVTMCCLRNYRAEVLSVLVLNVGDLTERGGVLVVLVVL